jgi:ABC-type multidrug transport system fused ATPase/permease subunit
VQNADLIYVLDKGRIVEVGNHQQLLSHGGIYRELYDKQFIDKEAL